MNNEKKFGLPFILKIAVTSLTVIIGIILTSVLGDIYFSGKYTSINIYTTESISQRKPWLILAFVIFVLLVITSIVMSIVFDKERKFLKRETDDLYESLKARRDLTAMDEEKKKIYEADCKKLLVIRIIDIAVCALLAIFPLCYVFNSSNFDAQGYLFGEATALAIHTLPFLLGMYIVTVICIYLRNRIQLNSIQILKGLKLKAHETKDVRKRRIIINVIRSVVFAVAVTFIIVGALRGEATDVLNKAVNICTECIGLG